MEMSIKYKHQNLSIENNIMFNSSSYLNNTSLKWRRELLKNHWTENAIDFTNSIKNLQLLNENELKLLNHILELFFILEGDVIGNGFRNLYRFGFKNKSPSFLSYISEYCNNEIVHAISYQKAYEELVLQNKMLTEDILKKLYRKYEQIEVFNNRKEELDRLGNENVDLNWKDFIDLSLIEGIQFRSLFLFIFYFCKDGNFKELGELNRYIFNDETRHTYAAIEFALLLKKEFSISDKEFFEYLFDKIDDFYQKECKVIKYLSLFLENENIENENIENENIENENIEIEAEKYLCWLCKDILNKYSIYITEKEFPQKFKFDKKEYKFRFKEYISSTDSFIVHILKFDNDDIPFYMEKYIINNIHENLHETKLTKYKEPSKIYLGIDDLF